MRIEWNRRLPVQTRVLWRGCVGLGALAALTLTTVPLASSRPYPPIAGPATSLLGIDCVSGSDCWAVGLVVNGTGARVNQAMRWNGKRWRLVSTPDPGGKSNADEQQLNGVSCLSASDCWAVGVYTNSSSMARLNEALHWNGKKWKLISTPNPGGTRNGRQHLLSGVSCVTRSDCWAVGAIAPSALVAGTSRAVPPGRPTFNQVLHWNGKRWSSVAIHDPAGKTGFVINGLQGVTCVRATDCWAVGLYRPSGSRFLNQAQRFNGRKWKVVSMPSPGRPPGMAQPTGTRQLPAVSCPSATACRAVGNYPNHSGLTLNEALRFDGKKWLVMRTPDQGGKSTRQDDELSGLACTAPSNCWAVGGFAGNASGFLNQALRWNGKLWALVRTPNPAGNQAHNQLRAIACASSNDCWAVGNQSPAMSMSASDEMLHWDGRKWKSD
ncbi:MAG TPA: hypothetical protein VFB39_18360 [Solirubrobacteraceae bacterium]|nr:hypothetical protein [Solirubrobacteraceae bacterium]